MTSGIAKVALVVSLTGGVAASPVGGIIHGRPDLGAHSNVGLLAYDFDGAGPAPWAALCTGSVISERAFLTAAHCIRTITSAAVRWGVTLEGGDTTHPVFRPTEFGPNDLPFVPVLVPVTAATSVEVHPQFGGEPSRSHDLAVLIFPPGTFAGIPPVELPAVGRLDTLRAAGNLSARMFTLVGYGSDLIQSNESVTFLVRGYRQTAMAPVDALTPLWLRLQVTVEATGGGGLCRGDSGSPYLDGNVALAIHSGDVSHVCMGGVTNGTRLDTQNARDFLSRFREP